MTNSLVNIDIGIDACVIKTVPRVSIKLDNKVLYDIEVAGTESITIEKSLSLGDHCLVIHFYNKNPKESGYAYDMAVLIKHIRFQHINYDFHLLSKYFPEYPQEFINEQRQQGKEWPESILSNHLGWNGKYVIDFQTPVYQWIHEKLDLGWLIR